MPIFPERQSIVKETPVDVDISQSLEVDSGIKKVETAFRATVKDNKGNPMVSAPATLSAKIQLPTDTTSLVAKAKGSIGDAATWLARFFLRLIAKQNANNNEL